MRPQEKPLPGPPIERAAGGAPVVTSRSSITLSGYYHLLRRNANFRRLWFAQLISGSGDWFYSVAIYDLLLRLTGSAKPVAIAVVLQILPIFIAGPTAGAVNDRLSRRRVILVTDVIRAVLVLGMLFIEQREQVWMLYLLLALEVTTAAFFESARNAVIPNLVAGADIPTANAIGSTTWSVTVTAGAGLGGLAVSFFGRDLAFVMNSVSFLLAALFVARMQFRETHLESLGTLRWREILGFAPILEGFRYVARDLRLAALLTLKFGLGILGARVVLIAVIGSEELPLAGHSALGMSVLFMFQGVGSIIGPLLVGPLVGARQSRMRWAVLGGYLTAGVCYMIFSKAESLATAGLCLVGAHAGGALVWVFSTTLLHLNTDDRFRGRVFAADLGLFMVTASVATYLCGWAIDYGVAARTAAFGVGLAMLFPSAAWALGIRTLWKSNGAVETRNNC